MEATVALCPLHPERPAEGTCSRCGTFLCEGCRKWQVGRMLCLRCHTVALGEKPSQRATLALIFATAGFIGFVPGLVGLVLGYQELAAIRRGAAPGSGEGWAILARNVGWFHVAMLVLIGLVVTFRS
ncbi:DUF4190 domain-containing protein [Corallococcus macrosporus]|uniref:DUF4190 domain-containing protein n=2 Tax=Myxococcaceae TaxID=31 RepID=A0A250JY57_9BACT|nr:DUF4190 domain-containing protein [Corallococcus macrosporus]ATB48402.1 hypothetical protein MYMAC_004029 [Corallococcus macrosporus DSM 14697]